MPRTINHPGEILLEEFIKPHGLNPSGFADKLGLPANRVTMIVNGERAITPETAILFAEAFGTTSQFWLNLQNHYELEKAKEEVTPERLERARTLHRELGATAR